MNNLLKEVWAEAGKRQNVNLKLFASSFFLLGLGIGGLQNHAQFKNALEMLTLIEHQEVMQRHTGRERMEARLDFLR
jgi:hypothetical protein